MPPNPGVSEASCFGRWLPGLPSPKPQVFRSQPLQTSASGATRPGPRVTFCTHKKSPKKRRGLPGPRFIQSDACWGDTQLPLKFCRPLAPRNRCGGYPTSPDGPRAERCCELLLSADCLLPGEAGSGANNTAVSTPSKGRQAKSDQIPATDQMPKSRSSVAAQQQGLSRPIGQTKGAWGLPSALLPTFPAQEK